MAERIEGVVIMYSEQLGWGTIKARENFHWFNTDSIVGEIQTIGGATVEFEVCAFHVWKAIGVDVLQVGSHRCLDHNGLEEYWLLMLITLGTTNKKTCELLSAAFNEATASSSISNSATTSSSISNSDQASSRVVTTRPSSRAGNVNADTNETTHPNVIDLITPVKRQRTESRLWEDFGDLCIGESLSSDELISKRVKEAEENGGPNFVDLSDE